MIYKKLNCNIQNKIDEKIKINHKKNFKEKLLFDLLKYFVIRNIDFIKSYLIY